MAGSYISPLQHPVRRRCLSLLCHVLSLSTWGTLAVFVARGRPSVGDAQGSHRTDEQDSISSSLSVLRNGTPFKDWVLPAVVERVRRKQRPTTSACA